MKTLDNERTVPGATSHQQNVAGSLQARCRQQKARALEYILFDLQSYGAHIDREHQIIAVSKKNVHKKVFKLTSEVRQHGWFTQIGTI
jgi:hypothetical protein